MLWKLFEKGVGYLLLLTLSGSTLEYITYQTISIWNKELYNKMIKYSFSACSFWNSTSIHIIAEKKTKTHWEVVLHYKLDEM